MVGQYLAVMLDRDRGVPLALGDGGRPEAGVAVGRIEFDGAAIMPPRRHEIAAAQRPVTILQGLGER